MKVYDMLAGKYGFGKSRLLSKDETLERIPTYKPRACAAACSTTTGNSTTPVCSSIWRRRR